ncbi:MAG TPA: ligase-associated DNA damage response endonuclease PdeM [Rhizomicrobium sp.]|nr:ligase-associated DNA damage response endonuclease PdeM [Rhizomicrobium sp.]
MSDPLHIIVNEETLLLEAHGAAVWPSQSTLIVSDLHFEKGSSFARRGQMLPPYDTLTTLARLAELITRHAPKRVIALGDSFHDSDGPNRLPTPAREMLASFIAQSEWIWIEGNHDPDLPLWLGGRATGALSLGNLTFRHEPQPGDARGEIAGHLHPSTTITRKGQTLRRRCFVGDGARLIMPAFGAFTGGLNVRDQAFAALFGTSYLAYALGARRVYAVAGNPQLVRRNMKDDSQPINAAINTVENP